MNLLSLGTSQRRLFAVHEVAAKMSTRPRAAVLCQPWGIEYTNAHRSMRQLAVKLAVAGWHVLRFDYYGTGDSGGEESEAHLAGCEADVEVAMEALADIADTTQVALIGLRVGANIAARVAARRVLDVEALVMWDPIVQTLELQPVSQAVPGRTAIFVTDNAQSLEQLRQTGFGHAAGPVTLEFVAAACPWVESATTTGMLPVPVIQRMVEWLR